MKAVREEAVCLAEEVGRVLPEKSQMLDEESTCLDLVVCWERGETLVGALTSFVKDMMGWREGKSLDRPGARWRQRYLVKLWLDEVQESGQ